MLCAWSWNRWTDVQIDFGGELYTAWRLAEGDVLYRDVAHRNGPLSPALNAALFQLFGVSRWTLVAANLLLLAGLTAGVYALLAQWAGRWGATAACAFFLAVQGFAQTAPIANFNYVTPYQHAQTHGLALALAMVAALLAAARGGEGAPRRAASALAGACLGAVFLTKAELFAPALAAAAVALGLGCAAPGALAAGFAVSTGAAFAWLASALPPLEAARGLAGNWAYLGAAAGDPYYRGLFGLDDPLANGARAAAASLAVAGFLAGAWTLDRALPRGRYRGPLAAAAGAGLVAACLGVAPESWPALAHGALARALPGLALAGVAACALAMWRDPGRRRALVAPALLAVLALGLLAKVALAPRFGHYGFALAAPAAWGVAAFGAGWLPGTLARAGRGQVLRALALAGLAVVAVHGLLRSHEYYAAKRLSVGREGERLLAEGPGESRRPAVLARLLEELRARAQPGETLLVWPEGVILNYWLRMENPTPYTLFLPPELRAFGEPSMLAALEAQPPDWVVLAHRRHEEFGAGPFGAGPDSGRAVRAWIDRHYARVERIGAEPFAGARFGAVLLERRAR